MDGSIAALRYRSIVPRSRSRIVELLSTDVASAVRREIALELHRVCLVAGAGAEDDAAVTDAAVVDLRALLGNARADQRAEQRACRAPRAGTRDRAGDWTGDDQADPRNRDRAGCREERSECGAHAKARR